MARRRPRHPRGERQIVRCVNRRDDRRSRPPSDAGKTHIDHDARRFDTELLAVLFLMAAVEGSSGGRKGWWRLRVSFGASRGSPLDPAVRTSFVRLRPGQVAVAEAAVPNLIDVGPAEENVHP
jgi:hypothetical protein